MASAADRNARRRLERLLADEDYGPKLARLRGQDERRVLRLIDENRGREARAAINEADEARRRRVRAQRRGALLERAVRHTIDAHREHYEADYGHVRDHLLDATDAELRYVLTADHYQLADRAREAPRVLGAREFNPFWYH